MCGLAGALVLDLASPFRVEAEWLLPLREALAHRGPDGAGTWVAPDGVVGLAHRRLAIIDPSPAAAQPMRHPEQDLWLVFNGEVYNHAELRRELEQLGDRRWTTDHSDTEVLLHAWARWGPGCLERLRGMFALAVWDGRARELWLVRDRLGVKPLYWAQHRGRLTFASEIKALLRDPEQERALDEPALHHYLSLLVAPAPATLLRGIRKLGPGEWLRARPGGALETRRWWWPWRDVRPLAGRSRDELAERVLEGLREAVRLRKVSDVPVGVFLSGGLDSSTNAVLFAEGERAPVRTFSVAWEGDPASQPDERPWARLAARAAGSVHEEQVLSEADALELLPSLAWQQDEPLADPVCLPLLHLSRLARRHGVPVCQVGEGADELFCGYPAWREALRRERLLGHAPRRLLGLGLLGLGLGGRDDGWRGEWLRRAVAGQPTQWSGAEALTELRKRRLYAPDLARRLAGLSTWDQVIRPQRERFLAECWEPTPFHWLVHADLSHRLPELLLMRVDKMSMAAGLEARVPFLDHALVELALSIPSATKTAGREPKGLLKHAVRGLLPQALIERKKQGFGAPLREWSRGRLGQALQEEVQGLARESGLFDPGAVAAELARGRVDTAWPLFNLALWWRQVLTAPRA